MSGLVDLTNKKFGELTVIRQNGHLSNGRNIKCPAWLCLCNCGKQTTARGKDLKDGNVRSCGCLHGVVHGLSNHPLFNVWLSMKGRCGIPDGVGKKNYAGRGITVCNEWFTFLPFYEWAKDKWSEGLQIDRKDNDGNYTPENCRFVTRTVNSQNSRRSKRWFINRKKYSSCYEAAKVFNVSARTICNWCNGYIRRGKEYAPKKGCYSELVY